MDRRTYLHIGMHIGGQIDTNMASDLQADRNISIYTCRSNTKMSSRVNTRTNDCSYACTHRPHILVRTHTHPRINIEVRSKKFGVKNKEYHGDAYMHQT